MTFYDSQVDFKHEKRKHEQHLRENDLKQIRAHHQTLKQYEGTYEVNKKNFLADLSRQNKLEVHANRAVRAQNARTVERLVKDKYKLDDHVLDAA